MKKHKHSKNCGCSRDITHLTVMEICNLIMDCGDQEKIEKKREIEISDEMLADSKFTLVKETTETP